MFGVFNVAAFIHAFFFFPETSGKTLEETEAMFEDPNGIKYLGTPAWKTSVQTATTEAMEHGDIDALGEKPAQGDAQQVEHPKNGEEKV